MTINQDEVVNSNGVVGVGGGNRVGDFLISQKEAFLGDFKAGNLKGWTVVMGNEAGDLDSIASSIAFSYLSSTLLADRVVPLVLTPSNLMHLRPENLLAFKLANKLDPSVLLHPDLIPLESTSPSALSKIGELGASFALVDHNKLLPVFGNGNVVAIIDHHDDEHAHLDAKLRLITVPTGSCSSLVAKHFKPQWEAATNRPGGIESSKVPREIATLLISAGLIDTAGFKSGGKATGDDLASAEFLYPLSTLHDSSQTDSLSDQARSENYLTVFKSLADAKQDVSALTTAELLLRDYKEYVLPTTSTAYPSLRAGLSTVPVGIKHWLEREQDGWTSFLAGVDKYMDQRELDIEGVLTSYSNKEGKHKREIMLVTKTGVSLKTSQEAKRIMEELITGFEASEELQLKEWEKNPVKKLWKKKIVDEESIGRFGRVWKQENKRATRKQVAPLLRDVVGRIQ